LNARLFHGAEPIATWPSDARAAAYGDGLFETMRVQDGSVPWWDAHWDRLARGAQRLRLSLPARAQVEDEVAALAGGDSDGVLKLLVSRGGGGRGYAPLRGAESIWMLSRHALPQRPPAAALRVHWCETRWATQPLLAGIKHCNRLEQVLARAECMDAGMDEGLMCDGDEAVVGATSANLFVSIDGRWLTPPVDRCGIAGICRSKLLPLLDAVESRLSVAQVEASAAVFLCNAVRGILPVARLGGRAWPSHAAVDDARQRLARIHPGFAHDIQSTERL
jgi:4-amino-4-deoxychorismate lyase